MRFMERVDHSFNIEQNKGRVILFEGPMGSGKSAHMISVGEKIKNHTGTRVFVARHILDAKGGEDTIGSRNGLSLKATIVENAEDLYNQIQERDRRSGFQEVNLIDEALFYGSDLVPVVQRLTDERRIVMISSLTRDAKGRNFDVVEELIGLRPITVHSHAGYCQAQHKGSHCNKPSTDSFKLYRREGTNFTFYVKGKPTIEGWEPAPAWSPTIDPQNHNNPEDVPEGEPFYIAVCPDHFQVPDAAATFEIEKVIRDTRGRGWSPGDLSHPRLGQILKYLTEDRGIRKVNKRYFAD